jgi:hypothetical protein
VVICDDLSSVVLYAAVLGKRIIIVPSGSDQIPAESFPARLAKIVPNLTHPGQLREMLETVLQSPLPAALQTLSAEINSRPGQGAELTRSEFYRLLDLTPAPSREPAAILQNRPHVTDSTTAEVNPAPENQRQNVFG